MKKHILPANLNRSGKQPDIMDRIEPDDQIGADWPADPIPLPPQPDAPEGTER